MHLIWENLMKNMIDHWTGEFKGLDDGAEDYTLSKALWKGIGEATAKTGDTIPSAYGTRVPNIAAEGVQVSAEMWSFWTLYIGPVLLRRRFLHERYYNHYIELVKLLTICLKFSISDAEIDRVETGFASWVETYESIRKMGPVWCYWAFPMERYCGSIKPGIRSRRFPFASLDRHVLETAQLAQIACQYGIARELSLRPDPKDHIPGSFADPDYPSCIYLPPRLRQRPENLNALEGALVTRFMTAPEANEERPKKKRKTKKTTAPGMKAIVRRHLANADVQEYGKIRRIDSEAGDTIWSNAASRSREDKRDATFVRYEMIVDKRARFQGSQVLEKETFYGQLQHLYAVTFSDPEALQDLKCEEPTTILMASIQACNINTAEHGPDLDIHFYSDLGKIDVVDVTCIQALIGRIASPVGQSKWAIIDRSGDLARAEWVDEEDE
ncbi:hypothetical protein BDZ89DRAFT_1093121 [Hymenopellis radicata]|nr:hypothetical protein BDZ89DRAFT_1093121 [Hymenopellis radicata]